MSFEEQMKEAARLDRLRAEFVAKFMTLHPEAIVFCTHDSLTFANREFAERYQEEFGQFMREKRSASEL